MDAATRPLVRFRRLASREEWIRNQECRARAAGGQHRRERVGWLLSGGLRILVYPEESERTVPWMYLDGRNRALQPGKASRRRNPVSRGQLRRRCILQGCFPRIHP